MTLTYFITFVIPGREPNLSHVSDPCTLIGDIHGQFYDMVKMLNRIEDPSKQNLIFMGDYVDRGMFSVEVILTLFALKINYPARVFLLRGNHESRSMTSFFNFRHEVLAKFDEQLYESFMDCFDHLPLACVVGQRYLVIHGGLSPLLTKTN